MRLILSGAAAALFLGPASAQETSETRWTDPKGFDPVVLRKVDHYFEGKIDQNFIDAAAPHRSIAQCGGDYEAPFLPSQSWNSSAGNQPSSEYSQQEAPEVIVPLEPEYDPVSWELRLESYCEANFDISAAGQPENIGIRCTLDPFVAKTRDALLAMRFAPAGEGERAQRSDITQPVAYCLPDPAPAS